jgi:hypothetical protein
MNTSSVLVALVLVAFFLQVDGAKQQRGRQDENKGNDNSSDNDITMVEADAKSSESSAEDDVQEALRKIVSDAKFRV